MEGLSVIEKALLAEAAINFALIIWNLRIHIRARQLLRDSELIWHDASSANAQAQAKLADANARARHTSSR